MVHGIERTATTGDVTLAGTKCIYVVRLHGVCHGDIGVMRVITLVMLLTFGGCGEMGSQGRSVIEHKVPVEHARTDETPSPTRGILIAMTDKHKIQNIGEATAARVRADSTGAAIVLLHKEIGNQDLDAQERLDKKREIDRLRRQYRRERGSLNAFYRELENKGKEYERILALKDPTVERIREEMKRIIETKGPNELMEIDHVRAEYERRHEELMTKQIKLSRNAR